MEYLTFEEAAVVEMYRRGSRAETVAAVQKARGYLDADEDRVRDLMDAVIGKLSVMTDREFCALDLTTPFDGETADGG